MQIVSVKIAKVRRTHHQLQVQASSIRRQQKEEGKIENGLELVEPAIDVRGRRRDAQESVHARCV
jgi:uncharacterized protein YaiL (DUF2058 family)